ncbi:MAG TPA: tRNA pseudouridine(13) synthase TruD [Caldilineales bacterium]|nr:tRNA pseudouridine(13) synthase TruD [Caldilineales bacterium]
MTTQLPYITPELPGAGGEIKAEPEHFIVEEVALYAPTGEGEHTFARFTREGQTTREVVQHLARALNIWPEGIGYAGLKDKHARVTQVFSLPGISPARAEEAIRSLGYEFEWAIPHNRKLRPGHLLGNRFTITILHPQAEDAMVRAQTIARALEARGLPNFFGEQRFGRFGDNATQGLAILTGQKRRPRQKWLTRLLISAYQSQLFNEYLALRMERGLFDKIVLGDLAKKTDTGGMFIVEDVAADQTRFDRGEITFTGPLFGYKMRQPQAEALALEADILARSPVTPDQWRKHRTDGNRRVGRIFLQPIQVKPHPLGLRLTFYLPKGAYATILLREVMKPASSLPKLETT